MKDRVTGAAVDTGGWRFGIHPGGLAAELRRMADDIDAGLVSVDRVKQSVFAIPDNFVTALVTIRYTEKGPAE